MRQGKHAIWGQICKRKRRPTSVQFRTSPEEALCPKKLFCCNSRLLENGFESSFRHVSRMIWNSRSIAGKRIPPNLMTAGRMTVKLKSEPMQFTDDLSIFITRKASHGIPCLYPTAIASAISADFTSFFFFENSAVLPCSR